MCLLFNMLSRFVIAFLRRSECLLISWLQSPSTVNFGAEENKICHCFHIFPICLPWSDGPDATRFVFWMFSFKPAFPLSSFTFIKRFFSSFSLSAIKVVSSAYPRLLFLPAVLIPDCGLSGWQSAWCTPHISQISQVTIRSLDYFLSQFWMFFQIYVTTCICLWPFFFFWLSNTLLYESNIFCFVHLPAAGHLGGFSFWFYE